MDDFAWSSQQKALKAIAEGRFREQILALEVPDGKKATRLFATDEHPRDTRVKSSPRCVRRLKPTAW